MLVTWHKIFITLLVCLSGLVEDIRMASKCSFLYTNAVSVQRFCSQKEGLPSCTMRSEQTKTFLREALTSRQLRVEIWLPEAGSSKKHPSKWKLAKAVCSNLQTHKVAETYIAGFPRKPNCSWRSFICKYWPSVSPSHYFVESNNDGQDTDYWCGICRHKRSSNRCRRVRW